MMPFGLAAVHIHMDLFTNIQLRDWCVIAVCRMQYSAISQQIMLSRHQ